MEKPHCRLDAWKVSMSLVEAIYRVTAAFPPHEQYGLISQMRRAAISIPSNLAEGAARDSHREFSQFISIARGSLSEVDTQLQIAVRLGYVSETSDCNDLIERASRLLTGLHKRIKEDIRT